MDRNRFWQSFKAIPSGVRRNREMGYLVLAILVIAVLADLLLNQVLAQRFRNDQEVSLTHELGTFRARLEERLNTNLFLVHGIAVYISVQSGISTGRFDALAEVTLGHSHLLKNIAIAPDFVITRVYPLAGNEDVIGLDYRKIPEQWPRARDARDTGRMAVAGPLKLVQGGRGLVARVPVFEAANGAFWGLVSAVIDYDELMKQVGLGAENLNLDIAIRGRDGQGDRGEVFWGDAHVFDPKKRAVVMPVSLPSGTWSMAAVPKGGWATRHPYRMLVHFSILGLTLVLSLSTVHRARSKVDLIESEKRLKAMSEASLDALVMLDGQDTILFWNPAAESMLGYSESEVVGQKFHDLVALPGEREKAKAGLKMFEKTGTGPVMDSIMEMEAVRKSGEIFHVERSVASFQIKEKWYAVGSLRDITARKQSERMLTLLATTDSLTGLSNRRHFMEQAERLLHQTLRYGRNFSIMMFDLDHFKGINDTYGHDAGDKVLQAVGHTVKKFFRETDIVGRIGGEEFAVAMPETDLDAARMAAERMRQELMETPVQTDVHTINFTVSFGVTELNSDHARLDDLMKKADESLYEAKRTGRNQVVARI